MKSLEDLHREIRSCRRCAERGFPIQPGAAVSGPATARVMVVGQAPGRLSAQRGRPFGGPGGRTLFRWLAEAGWDEETFRTTHYFTAVTKCFPGRTPDGRGDRVPTAAERELCRPFLEQELALIRPALVVTLGKVAAAWFLGNDLRLEDLVGKVWMDAGGRSVLPLPHPSGRNRWLNDPANRERLQQALVELRRLKEEAGL